MWPELYMFNAQTKILWYRYYYYPHFIYKETGF